MSGTLYVVATPIGNLEDITRRAERILGEVDLVAAEDTRRTGRLLEHLGLTRPLLSLFTGNEAERTEAVLRRLRAGERVALVSDAGTPLISDPGARLVTACRAEGIAVVPIPGVTALATALSACGLRIERFRFEGFLPRGGGERRRRLDSLGASPVALVFYESPHRLASTLADLASVLSQDRDAVVGRELTKLHEEFVRGTLAELAARYADKAPVGEVTLVVGPPAAAGQELSDEEVEAVVRARLASGDRPKGIAAELAAMTGRRKRWLYALAVRLDKEPG